MVSYEGEGLMSTLFRLALFGISAGTLVFALKKIRAAQARIDDMVFWILFLLGLVVISVFPGIAVYTAGLLEIESTANFVFLCIIFLLLIKVFNLSLKLSKQQYQIQRLSQLAALERFEAGRHMADGDEVSGDIV
jgi:hypothetical protein